MATIETTEVIQTPVGVPDLQRGLGRATRSVLKAMPVEPHLLVKQGEDRDRHLKVREMVNLMEQSLIDCIADYGLKAERQDGAPGVYIDGAKIAALGLRVRNGRSYHGLSLNVDMDLTPFTWINPCGYSGLRTIQLKDFGVTDAPEAVAQRLLGHLQRHFPEVPPTA